MTKRVYVTKPWADGALALFGERKDKYDLVARIQDAEIVVWNGGEDIHPSIYGENPIPGLWLGEERDRIELKDYHDSPEGCFKFGICRGGQLLNCLSGGKLYQHVDGHQGRHLITDVWTGEELITSSVHHQQMILGPEAQLVAYSTGISHIQRNEAGQRRTPEGYQEPEVAFYPNTRSLCIQGHPEYSGYSKFTEYCLSLIDRYWEVDHGSQTVAA